MCISSEILKFQRQCPTFGQRELVPVHGIGRRQKIVEGSDAVECNRSDVAAAMVSSGIAARPRELAGNAKSIRRRARAKIIHSDVVRARTDVPSQQLCRRAGVRGWAMRVPALLCRLMSALSVRPVSFTFTEIVEVTVIL